MKIIKSKWLKKTTRDDNKKKNKFNMGKKSRRKNNNRNDSSSSSSNNKKNTNYHGPYVVARHDFRRLPRWPNDAIEKMRKEYLSGEIEQF